LISPFISPFISLFGFQFAVSRHLHHSYYDGRVDGRDMGEMKGEILFAKPLCINDLDGAMGEINDKRQQTEKNQLQLVS